MPVGSRMAVEFSGRFLSHEIHIEILNRNCYISIHLYMWVEPRPTQEPAHRRPGKLPESRIASVAVDDLTGQVVEEEALAAWAAREIEHVVEGAGKLVER